MAIKKESESKEIKTEAQKKPAADHLTVATGPTKQQVIYIGPTIRKNGIGLRTNQVFIGGRPDYLKALFAEYPHMQTLFVPVDKLQESLKQIKQTGTALNVAILSMKGV
ncbi:hypothetical protein [Paenibacillus campinasensis]|uniref:Uncharacterized protein n=1 Tax=Paenibacillus campinasensis TaxID=66347 RepID=A0A268ELB2_9BACL|nr:hypothetical protein [Paenibacillus campinasensis]PAD73909.1 hypothetical protein CHH67_18925 [Paenibacillus campinasensis]